MEQPEPPTMPRRPSYSTKPLRRAPAKGSFFQVDVENDWALLAEAMVGSHAQLDQLVLVLESHGVVVHRVPSSQPKSPSTVPPATLSSFTTEPNDGSTPKTTVDDRPAVTTTTLPSSPRTLFSLPPRNAALVHGTRVIEAPPAAPSQSKPDAHSEDATQRRALFDLLENAGAEVVRWPVKSGEVPEGELVDIQGSTLDAGDKEEEGPRFSPSDIIILSPTLLITRLSSSTNNRGLEYLWSVLSRPSLQEKYGSGASHSAEPPPDTTTSRATTTLIVRITDPGTLSSPTNGGSAVPSPRTPTFPAAQIVPQSASTTYVPLCRALVPLGERVMLYDPALVAEGEARRLKSVLDRVEEGSGGDTSAPFAGQHSKRDSVMSYGTFGSLNRSDGNGWQFVSVDGLYSTSILLVSPELALLSAIPTPPEQNSPDTNHDALAKVSQALESLGVRTVLLPLSELEQLGSGVRDTVLVLRRESNVAPSEHENVEGQREAWDQQGEEASSEGCIEAICASLTAWLCGAATSSGASDTEGSE